MAESDELLMELQGPQAGRIGTQLWALDRKGLWGRASVIALDASAEEQQSVHITFRGFAKRYNEVFLHCVLHRITLLCSRALSVALSAPQWRCLSSMPACCLCLAVDGCGDGTTAPACCWASAGTLERHFSSG